jgi:hypothetical protein
MSSPFTATGGARVGWMNASWPLAHLTATPERLAIWVFLSGTYEFAPSQVVAIERYVMIPVLGWGVRIVHCRADYPRQFVFWYLDSPESILQGIRDAGFLPVASAAEFPPRRGFPLRWSAILGAIVVWNGLFTIDYLRSHGDALQPGPFILLALFFAFALSVATLKSPKIQRCVLKPGRDIGEIRAVVGLLAFISGIMLVVLSLILASGGFHRLGGN